MSAVQNILGFGVGVVPSVASEGEGRETAPLKVLARCLYCRDIIFDYQAKLGVGLGEHVHDACEKAAGLRA